MVSRRRQMANVLSGYVRLGVDIGTKLYVTRLLIARLGIGEYGLVTFVISVGVITTVMGNALSGAAARYVTQGVARNESTDASRYLSNTLVMVVVIGMAAMALAVLYAGISPSVQRDIPLGFLACMLVSGMLQAVASTLSCGTFVCEAFFVREGTRCGAHLVNAFLITLLFCTTPLGVWSVAVGYLASASLEVAAFYLTLHRFLPSVRLSLSLVSRRTAFEVAGFVGWMLLAYCGQYITRSGTMVVIQAHLPKADLGRYGLAAQVGGMILQGLTMISYLTAPTVYRALAHDDYRTATRTVERFLYLSVLAGTAAGLLLWLEGDALLRVWLGASAPGGMPALLVGMAVGSGVASFRIPVSGFLAGCNRLNSYGIATLLTGCLVVTSAFFLLRDGQDRMVQVVWLTAAMVLLQNVILAGWVHRDVFCFSGWRTFLGKVGSVAVVAASALGLWWLSRYLWASGGWVPVGLRSACLAGPFALGFALHIMGTGRSRRRPPATAPQQPLSCGTDAPAMAAEGPRTGPIP